MAMKMKSEKIIPKLLACEREFSEIEAYCLLSLKEIFSMQHIEYHVDYFYIKSIENIRTSIFIIFLENKKEKGKYTFFKSQNYEKNTHKEIIRKLENMLIESLTIYNNIPIYNNLLSDTQYIELIPAPEVVFSFHNKDKDSQLYNALSTIITTLKNIENLKKFDFHHKPIECNLLESLIIKKSKR